MGARKNESVTNVEWGRYYRITGKRTGDSKVSTERYQSAQNSTLEEFIKGLLKDHYVSVEKVEG